MQFINLPRVIEAISDDVSGGEEACEAVLCREVVVQKLLQGDATKSVPAVGGGVDVLQDLQCSVM